MRRKLSAKRTLVLWQLLFILLGTSWLWAPQLNHFLSYKTSLISQYESPAQPYAWVFRLSDALAAILLILAALALRRYKSKLTAIPWIVLLVIGLGMLVDSSFASACRLDQADCREHLSFTFIVHAAETVVTAMAIFFIALYDSWIRKRLVSILFVVFQTIYGLLLISQLASHDHFNTLSQYIYQTILIIWLAWLVYGYFNVQGEPQETGTRSSIVRNVVAVWAFLNGVVAIFASLTHLHLLGNARGLYFAGDTAWLAQHGVVTGVVMIYLSRHLARGERRARQIFLFICSLEIIKYSLITPHFLLAFYVTTFCGLFVLRDEFYRGTIVLTWRKRLKEAGFMAASLSLVAGIILILLNRDNEHAEVAAQAIDHFFDYTLRAKVVPRSHLADALLAHTISAFFLISIAVILWILFKPYKKAPFKSPDYKKITGILTKYSSSSEDYFKLWPPDKQYFWSNDKDGFIAYKITGGVAFALADPVARKNNRAILVSDFVNWCRARRLVVCFLPVYQSSLNSYTRTGLNSLQIGASAVINIDDFLNKTAQDKWWRWQKNRAIKSGYFYDVS